MKKFFLRIMFAAICVFSFASCATVTPVGATANTLGSKRGEATELRVFCIPVTETGIDQAAKAAGITKISHIEQRTQFLYPAFGKRKIVVYGE